MHGSSCQVVATAFTNVRGVAGGCVVGGGVDGVVANDVVDGVVGCVVGGGVAGFGGGVAGFGGDKVIVINVDSDSVVFVIIAVGELI